MQKEPQVVTDKDRQEWAHHPVTLELVATLLASKADAMENWARERFVDENPLVAAQKNAAAIGGIRVVDQILDLVENFKHAIDDGQLELL